MAKSSRRDTDVAARTGNLFLDRLPLGARAALTDSAKRIELRVRDPIYGKGQAIEDVYFPTDGAISNVLTMANGSQLEVGLIGREGIVGYPAVLAAAPSATDLYTQIAGAALRVSGLVVTATLDDVRESRSSFWHYSEAQTNQLAQYAACNKMHSLEERFARWLTMAHDRIAGDELILTQEFLSLMLGVRRAGVTVAAATFQEAGFIRSSRGRLTIIDRNKLRAAACECYDAVEDRFEAVLGYSIRKQ